MIFSKNAIGGQFGWLDDLGEGQYAPVLDKILGAIDALLVVLDKEGKVVWFNKRFSDLFGYSLAEVKGKYFWDVFVAPEEVSLVRNGFNSLGPGISVADKEAHLLSKGG